MDNINSKINFLKQKAFNSIFVLDLDEALKNLQAAEVIDSKNPEIIANLGIVYFKKELFSTASEYFEKLIALNSGFIDEIKVYKLLSICYLNTDNFDKSLIYINKVLLLKNDDVDILNIKAYCLNKKGDINSAISIYKYILKIDNCNKTSLNSYSYLLARKNIKINEALNIMLKIYEENNAAHNDTLGFIYMKLGDVDNARKYLYKAKDLKPFNKEIIQNIQSFNKLFDN